MKLLVRCDVHDSKRHFITVHRAFDPAPLTPCNRRATEAAMALVPELITCLTAMAYISSFGSRSARWCGSCDAKVLPRRVTIVEEVCPVCLRPLKQPSR